MSFTDNCCQPGPILNRSAEGTIESINGIKYYQTGSSTDSFIIYSPDVFGPEYEHNQKNADYLASEGFTVLIPDVFEGDSIANPAEYIAKGREFFMTNWLPKHQPAHTINILRSFIQSIIQSKGKSIKLFGAGFCYGAFGLWHLNDEKTDSSIDNFKAFGLAHPSFLQVNEWNLYKVPTIFLLAEVDNAFTPEHKTTFEKELKGQSADVEFIEYPGTEHGFVARGDESVQPQREKALQDMARFFKKHL